MPVHACVAHQIYQNSPISMKNEINSHVVLSGLCLTSIPSTVLKNRTRIEKLTLDNNVLTENSFNMPKFANLKELSVRNNKIRNLGVLLANIQKNCPNIEVLRVKNNPGIPEKFTEKEKMLISKVLKKLRVLNGLETHRQKRYSGCSTDSKTSSGSE
ncbi:LRRcap domain-containing protein [Caenorhabditis elegans]|uniref:LRRcap domain-containing protein n=1 Tax=Caenorhabditis elegans TaxID=6239 RepID=Q22587_CAEEL|nr:LRRcap domain-containing protein [Caenorhabditis elegans]CCD73154.1 LRRcap domain-containing protein [Caenorhabditis elegans]|eukprot:NP_508138.2 Uncharacterized protein CELE_T19D7.6 [Caenorhabditis elegans]